MKKRNAKRQFSCEGDRYLKINTEVGDRWFLGKRKWKDGSSRSRCEYEEKDAPFLLMKKKEAEKCSSPVSDEDIRRKGGAPSIKEENLFFPAEEGEREEGDHLSWLKKQNLSSPVEEEGKEGR